jgi:predicted dehydrogenase
MMPPSIPASVDRRSFMRTLSIAGTGLALGPLDASARELLASIPAPTRYALVGTGIRSQMYRTAMLRDYRDTAELVGLCDTNPGRLELARTQAAAEGVQVPGFLAADFDRMIRETRPNVVIVTTVDATHDEYIVRALNLGCDVITEKPMTTTAPKCQRILDTAERTGRTLRVTFNYRYAPARTQVKDLLMSGEVGDILSVDFHWLLNTMHGADYFRRWHSQKRNSGGLMVHKATHHFDLVNWWLGAVPVQVFATGKREFYTPTMARRLGLASHHERCRTCPEKERCTFFFDLAGNANLKALYLDQEHHDRYYRDQCVFRPDIDIEDTMNVMVKYDTGATLSYSLNAFNSWEGYTIAFNGTKGRLEHTIVEQIYVSGTNTVQGGIAPGGITTRIVPLRGPARVIEPWTASGGHGGGDQVMLDEIFRPGQTSDKYLRASDQYGGACSILIGIAANRCFETGQPVTIADLVTGLRKPRYAPMPTSRDPVPMPPVIRRD